MNPLSKYPHLFSNRKFMAMFNGMPDLIVGCRIFNNVSDVILENEAERKAEHCTLIARPIESLTDEELDQVYPWESEIRRQILKNRAREGYLNREPFLKLLELGAYPFDQSHFGDTVIDTCTLTNA